MNISTENLLSELNAKEIWKQIGGIIFVSLMMVIGAIGNGHVLYVYGRKMKPSNHRTFIFVLGVVDMTACCVGMPIILVHLTHPLTFPMPSLCKTVAYVNHFDGLMSSTLMLVVTVDRYRKVCRPLNWQISNKMAKILCGLVTLFGILSSWPALFLFGHTTVETGYENVTGVTCLTDDQFVNTDYPTLYNTFLIFVLIFTFGVHIVLYIFICRTLFNRDRWKSTIKAAGTRKSIPNDSKVSQDLTISHSMNRVPSSDNVHSSESVTSLTDISIIQLPGNPNLEPPQPGNQVIKTGNEVGTPCRRKYISTKQNIVESARNVKNQTQQRLETRRITIIFFSIVAVFMISYTPYLTLQIVEFSTNFLRNLSQTGTIIRNTINWSFYINNMSNAIVYIFLDKKFRAEVVRIYTCS